MMPYELVKLHNAVTFQILHHVVTFDEKWQNLPTLGRYYETLGRYYETWVDIMKMFKK